MAGEYSMELVGRRPDARKLFGRPMRRFYERAMFGLHALVTQPGRVPIDTGHLRATLGPGAGVTMVDPGDPPRFAQVGTSLQDYPRVLDEDSRYHYRAGPSAFMETLGWFSTALDAYAPEFEGLLDGLEKDIGGEWAYG